MELDFSVWFPLPEKTPYSVAKLEQMFFSIVHQTNLPKTIYIFNRQDAGTLADKLFGIAEKKGISCEIIPAKNQFLAACAHVLAKMTTPYYIYIQNESAPVYLRQSAFGLFCWTATRKPQTGLFYAEYDLSLIHISEPTRPY